MKTQIFIVFLFIFITYPSATKIADHGPNNKRVNLVIMGDGFTASQQGRFDSLANLLRDSLFSFTPYSQYADFINLHKLNLVSQDSGTDLPGESLTVNTVLDGFYNALPSIDLVKAGKYADDSIGQWDAAIVILNYDVRSGVTDLNISTLCLGGDFWNVCRHEIGHALANLGDEYVSPPGNTTPPFVGTEPNIAYAPDTTPTTVPWAPWVTNIDYWPTPNNPIYQGYIGLFAGAKYTQRAYRSEYNCMMRQGSGAYCRICTEAIVLKIKTITATPIDTPSFNDKIQVGYTNLPVEFRLGLLGSNSLKYDIHWSLDGAPLPDSSSICTIDPIGLNLGTSLHSLKTIVKDTSDYWYRWASLTSPFVKNDPKHLMSDTIQWTLVYGIGNEQHTFAQAVPTLSVQRTAYGVRIQCNPQGNYNLGIYNIQGQRVADFGSGYSRITFERTYAPRSAGMYFVRLIANKKQYTNKVVFFR